MDYWELKYYANIGLHRSIEELKEIVKQCEIKGKEGVKLKERVERMISERNKKIESLIKSEGDYIVYACRNGIMSSSIHRNVNKELLRQFYENSSYEIVIIREVNDKLLLDYNKLKRVLEVNEYTRDEIDYIMMSVCHGGAEVE